MLISRTALVLVLHLDSVWSSLSSSFRKVGVLSWQKLTLLESLFPNY
jgi:hypothetical protein